MPETTLVGAVMLGAEGPTIDTETMADAETLSPPSTVTIHDMLIVSANPDANVTAEVLLPARMVPPLICQL